MWGLQEAFPQRKKVYPQALDDFNSLSVCGGLRYSEDEASHFLLATTPLQSVITCIPPRLLGMQHH